MSTGQNEVLTKTLRNGSECRISIVPDPIRPGDEATTLSWWLLFTDQTGRQLGKMKARPRELPIPAAPGLTHAISIKNGTAIGLTQSEATRIDTALDQWVADRKAAAAAAREELAARVRAAAPDAPTWTISSAYGVPGIGATERLDDGTLVTSLGAWNRYYREDGMCFGAADDAGYVYYAEVRAATEEEAAPVLAREEADQHRKQLHDRVKAEIVAPAQRPDCADEAIRLASLPEVKFGEPSIHLQVDREAGVVWVLHYNGYDGDNWSYNNYGSYIATCVALTPERADLLAQLATVASAA